MSSHVHFGLVGHDDPLGAFLHPLNSRFGGWWNRQYGGLGPVFAERPKSVVVDRDEQLARLVAYIHNNPVRAGLVDDPADSDWTSHRAFVGMVSPPPWLDVEWTLAAIGFSSSTAGRAAFHDYVVSRAAMPRDPVLSGPGPTAPGTLARLVSAVSCHTGVAEEKLQHTDGDRHAADARELLVLVAVTVFGMRGVEIARELGIGRSTVSRVRRRGRATPRTDDMHAVVDVFLAAGRPTDRGNPLQSSPSSSGEGWVD